MQQKISHVMLHKFVLHLVCNPAMYISDCIAKNECNIVSSQAAIVVCMCQEGMWTQVVLCS